MEFDPKEHANWLVSRGVPTERLICPMCDSTGLLRALNLSAMYHIDAAGEVITEPETGRPTGVNIAALACANCGFLRLFVANPDALPEPGG